MRYSEFKLDELTFHGRPCTKDCSGHKAGWEWERAHQTNRTAQTPSPSFNDGTDIAVTQRKAGKQPIGHSIRGAGGRFQKFQKVKEEQDVDEMIGVKKYQNLTVKELMTQIANDYDLKVLGYGALGYVLSTHDPNTVVKVFESDDAYLSFVNYIQAHPNKHYPRIVKNPRLMTAFYKRYPIQPNKFVVLSIERLKELPPNLAEFAADVANAKDPYDKPMKLPNGRMNGGEYDPYTDDIDKGQSYYELSRDYPWILSLWEAGHQVLRSKKVVGNRDLHYGNLMQREDGTIVITDPVSDPNTLARRTQIFAMPPKEKMIKGPHYRTTPADKKSMPARPDQTDTNLDRAFAELEELHAIEEPTSAELSRINKLEAYIDQKIKLGQ